MAKYPDFTGAACREGQDVELFFPVSVASAAGRKQVAEAKEVCAGCVKRLECLVYAIEKPEAYGVWGGLDEEERSAERRRRMRRRSSVALSTP
jgi:WhiB family redox-sensing transcriptional regulator